MPTREELHKLIDSVPDGAVEAAFRSLTHLQVWPPIPPPTVEQWREQTRKRREERRLQWSQQLRPGTVAGFGGSSNYNPDTGAGSSSFHYWEEDTFVAETMRRHKGHDLTVIERIRVDGRRLIYKHEVTGPGEKRDEREIVFEVPSV
jgi:hypothetical protein